MFGRNKEPQPAQATAEDESSSNENPETRNLGKGAPTPKRKSQEAARKRPLVPNDRKEAKARNREAQQRERARMRQALDTGEEKYLPLRDKGPQRRFVRDYVDARYNAGEYLIIAAFVFVLITFIPIPGLTFWILIAFWAMFAIVFVDGFLLHRRMKGLLTRKFGLVQPGTAWYAVTRSAQLRRLRLPKPMVKRGEYPDAS